MVFETSVLTNRGDAGGRLNLDARAKTPLLLRLTLLAILVIPSSLILQPFGAVGTVPILLCLVLLLCWIASSLWGLHNPLPVRHPGRLAVSVLLLASFASYVAMYAGWTGGSTVESRAAADRWLVLLFASAALVLVIAEAVRTIADALQLARVILAGAFFCCLVAFVQFVFHVNPVDWMQSAMPGFTSNGGDTPFQNRGTLTRVAGTTFHSIELGVVAAMLLPLSIWRGIYDPRGRPWFHWVQTAFLVFAVAASVSRSGVLGVTVAMIVFIPFLPRLARRWMLVAAPVAVAGICLAVPGFLGTISSILGADASDPSIANRVNNYPLVVQMVDQRPVLGSGPGNYTHADALHILDNQYLGSMVTLGLVGLVATIVYFVLPGIASILAAQAAAHPALRSLAGALAGGTLVAGVCSTTFDSLSFPVFSLVYPALVGLAGGVWQIVRQEAGVVDGQRDTVPGVGAASAPFWARFVTASMTARRSEYGSDSGS